EEMSRDDLLNYVKSLNEEKSGKLGLIWDREKVPEEIVQECDKKVPVLKNIEEKNIVTNNTSSINNNLLIEGDNFHGLSVLSYTHNECVDVIYIDPPYNTENKDFMYNDKFIDPEDGYRHSKWLNFMEKRLKLARKLLKENGMIFISIDDNELFQLKLLCDKIFGEKNYVNTISINAKVSAGASGGGEDKKLKKNIEYVLFYCKKFDSMQLNAIYKEAELMEYIKKMSDDKKSFKYTSVLYKIDNIKEIGTIKDGSGDDIKLSKVNSYEIKSVKQVAKIENISEEEVYNKYFDRIMTTTNAQTSIRTRVWNATGNKNEMYIASYIPKSGKNKGQKTELIFMGKQKVLVIWLKDTCLLKKGKIYKKEKIGTYWDGFSWINVTKEGAIKFDNGKKPIKMIKQLISLHPNKNALVLDFFAGSGSTGHAVLELNKEDHGKRQFILCTNNEVNLKSEIEFIKKNKIDSNTLLKYKKNNNSQWLKYIKENGICSSITYPRMNNVINGYTNKKALGGNLLYFKTDFVEMSSSRDQLYYDLTEKCIPMLCVKENTHISVEKNIEYNIYTNEEKNKYTCVYFDAFGSNYLEFIKTIEQIDEYKSLYIFTLGNEINQNELVDVKNYEVEPIPYKILELYNKIIDLSKEM
ncbi:MAG: site-specific DNA-methyltransferase, partial [Clostridia bacterium]|nr:site-specific DNA-methyltransferase [Clostridia bacterium]